MVNDSASKVIVRPMAVMAARVLGPGRTRLKLIKLVHNLGDSETVIELPRGGHDETLGGHYTADPWAAADIVGDAG